MTPDPTPAGEEPRRIDLDAARRARAEQRRKDGRGAPPVVTLDGVDYKLPAELPAETAHAFGALASGDYAGLGAGMEALFGGRWQEIHDAAIAAGEPLSLDDEVFLLEEAMDAYGMPLPESPASAGS